MVNLYKYFELWNNIYEATSSKILLFTVLTLISVSAGTYFITKSVNDITDKKSLILAGLFTIGSSFSVFSVINVIPNYQNQIINDVKIEIKEKYNIKLTNKQITKLLIDQPAWANELSKKRIKSFYDTKIITISLRKF